MRSSSARLRRQEVDLPGRCAGQHYREWLARLFLGVEYLA